MINGITMCGLNWRCVCTDRKHPDGNKYLVLIDKGSQEIAVAVSNFVDPIKNQWFDDVIYLMDGGL